MGQGLVGRPADSVRRGVACGPANSHMSSLVTLPLALADAIQKSLNRFSGKATRKALSTAARSITSWATAPATGGKQPAAANPIPTTLKAIPPSALAGRSTASAAPRARTHRPVRQRAIHHHGAGGLGRDIAVLSESHANRGGRKCRRVVDAVAQVERLSPRRFLATISSFSSGLRAA